MDRSTRLKRLRFRAWHRGTKEADLMIGGFFDRHGEGWAADQLDWFEALLEEQDVDIMAWAIGTLPVPARWQGAMMDDLKRLNFVPIATDSPPWKGGAGGGSAHDGNVGPAPHPPTPNPSLPGRGIA